MNRATADLQTVQAAGRKRALAPRLREITLEDYAQIASLTAPYGFTPSVWTCEQWRHLWLNNPAYTRIGRKFPLGWVLEAEKRIVGHVGNFPLFYQLDGQQLLTGNGYSFVVEAEYRGYALFLLDQYMNQKRVDVVLSNHTNRDAFAAHVELGAKAVPLGAWDRKSVWVASYQEFLADWLGRKGLPASGFLSYPAGPVLWMKDARSRMLLRKRADREVDLEMGSAFDGRFDNFWNELCIQYPHRFLAGRMRASLEWRFYFALREKRIWIATFSRGRRLRSFAIFLLQKNRMPEDPIRRMIVADFQSLDRDDGIFYAMLRAALERSRQCGIHLLVTMGFSASGTDISAMAPYRGPLAEHSTSLYKTTDPRLSRTLEDPQVWCPSLYDGDLSL